MEQLDARTRLLGTQSQLLAPNMRITAGNTEQGELKRLVKRHPNSSVTIALRVISTSVNPEVLAALLTMDGGETATIH